MVDSVLQFPVGHNKIIFKSTFMVTADRSGVVDFRINHYHIGAMFFKKRFDKERESSCANSLVAQPDFSYENIDAVD